MLDRYAFTVFVDDSYSLVEMEDIEIKARNNLSIETHPMQRILIIHDLITIPNGATTYVSAFANEQVSLLKQVFAQFRFFKQCFLNFF